MTQEELANSRSDFNEESKGMTYLGQTAYYKWLLGTKEVEQAADKVKIALELIIGTCRRYCEVCLHLGCSSFCDKSPRHTCAHICPLCLSKLQQRVSQGIDRRDGQCIIDDRKEELACLACRRTKFGQFSRGRSLPVYIGNHREPFRRPDLFYPVLRHGGHDQGRAFTAISARPCF